MYTSVYKTGKEINQKVNTFYSYSVKVLFVSVSALGLFQLPKGVLI